MKKRIFMILICIYVLFLIFFVILKFDGSFEEINLLHQQIIENEQADLKNVNLVPFKTISPYLKNITEMYAFKNIMGNIIIFFPLGFFVSYRFSKKVLKPMIICMLTILFIECIQLIFKIGFFDVDDILLNSIGCLFGIYFNFFWYIFTKTAGNSILVKR
mgnify:CR=1 FL=1